MFSSEDRLTAANAAFQQKFFADPEHRPTWREFMKQNFDLARGPRIETNNIEEWLTSASSQRGTMPFRAFEAEWHDGTWMWVTESVQVDGTLLLIATDVTSLSPDTRAIRNERDAARRASWTDDLTGLANRRYVINQLLLRLEEVKVRPDQPSHAIALLDIDHFKTINDQYGHETGDAILIAFSRLVVDNLRVNDLFGRIGGEEFLMMMPNMPLNAAKARVEHVLKLVGGSIPIPQLPECRYTFSAGLTTMSPDDDIDSLLRRVDELLYRAKRAGRIQVSAA
jgi:diguanylate cyclase (GGDEF)-like protein